MNYQELVDKCKKAYTDKDIDSNLLKKNERI